MQLLIFAAAAAVDFCAAAVLLFELLLVPLLLLFAAAPQNNSRTPAAPFEWSAGQSQESIDTIYRQNDTKALVPNSIRKRVSPQPYVRVLRRQTELGG